jgi:hypothetical protein
MPAFPVLKTGAVAQYPATRSMRFQNQAVRFVDGTEQKYRDSAGMLRRWQIALDLLDEGEMAAMEGFFSAAGGSFETFSFTDPWDGTVYPNCGLESDTFEGTARGEKNGRAVLVVRERRV